MSRRRRTCVSRTPSRWSLVDRSESSPARRAFRRALAVTTVMGVTVLGAVAPASADSIQNTVVAGGSPTVVGR